MPRRPVIIFILLLFAFSAAARDRPIELERPNHTKMRAYNVGITAFFAVFSAMRQGQIKSWRDVPRHLLIGGGAGAAFYEAKRMTGDGRKTAGWLLANAASSVIENAAEGEHLAGRFGYTVGPFRLRVATPYARKGVAIIDADWSIAQTGFLAVALSEGDSVSIRNGLIAVDRETAWDLDGRHPEGVAFGVFPGVIPGAARTTWQHEMVHAIQSQQFDAVEPPQWTFGRERAPGERRPLFRLRHIRPGYTHLLDLTQDRRDYEDRWGEVEAWWLAEETPVHP